MFRFLNQSSIKQITFLLIIFSGIFTFAFAFLVIFNEKIELKKDIEATKSEYMQNKKDIIVARASKIYKMIEYYSTKSSSHEELKTHVANILQSVFVDFPEVVYPFVYAINEEAIYDPFLTKHQEKRLSFVQTKDKVALLQKIKEFGSGKGGFFQFESFSENDKQSNSGLLYVREANKQGWIVGAGTYLDDFKSVITQKKEESKNKIVSFILKIATLTLVLYVVSIMKYRFLTKRLSRELEVIDNAFIEASKTYKFIDEKNIHLTEFKQIATHANKMIKIIKANTNKLQVLNTNLEKIVEDKTSKLKQSVELSNRLLNDQDKFINNALHEINTPLSIILMNTEMYHLKHEKNPYFEKIEAAVKVLETINEDLSYIAKKDRIKYEQTTINFSNCLKERVEYFLDVAYQSELFFTCKIQEDVFISFNETELLRILDNNISNAIKYSYPHTSIDIVLFADNKKVKFIISNRGDKIENVKNLFDRYYRENLARGGFGLGLNIVRDICEKNGIKIDVASKSGFNSFEYEFWLNR